MQRDYPVQVEWKAFELRPGTPPEGIPKPFKPGETNDLRGHMKEAAEASGLFKMRRQELTPNCRPALEAAVFAREKGVFDQYHKSVFEAFWEEGRNIGDPEVLRSIIEACGLNWEEFDSPEEHSRYAQRVEGQLAESRMYGITGVPAFILDRYLISGAQPYEVFQQVMEQIQKENSSPDPPETGN